MKSHRSSRALALAVALTATAPALAEAPRPVAPLPGRDRIAPGKPDWCAGYEPTGSLRASFVQGELDAHGFTHKALNQVAQLACEQPLDADLQRTIAGWRQDHVNATGLSARHDHDQLALRVDPAAFDRALQAFCAANRPGDEASIEQRALAGALGCGGATALAITADGTARDLAWWIDRRAEVGSEVARAVFVLRCLRNLKQRSDGTWDDLPAAADPWNLGAYAVCGLDGRRLDEAALDQELAAPPWTDAARANARAAFALARVTTAALTDAYQAMAAKDPTYRKLLFDAPEAGWKAWQAAYKAHQAAYDAALAYEDKLYGPSKKALASCGGELRAAWAGYVAGKQPRTVSDARRAATDEIGYVLLASMALCDAVVGRFLPAWAELELVKPSEAPIQRGPRMAAYRATLAALNDVVADRGKFAWQPSKFAQLIEPPREDVLAAIADRIANKTAFDNPSQGTISAITKTADGVQVSFRAAKTTIPNRICTPNRRVLAVRDGNVIYDSDCVTRGTVTLDQTPKPVVVAPEVAGGLKPGQRAVFQIDQRDLKLRRGFPLEAWQGDKLVVYAGAAL